MSEEIDIATKLRASANGHPAAKIPWPHRVLHEGADEIERLRGLINNPQTDNFLEAVRIEAAHQVERWGEAHDARKTPDDWLWALAFLSTKATQAARYGDGEKYLHHIITCAAACLNWHRHATAAKPLTPRADGGRG